MRVTVIVITAAIIGAALALSACQHRLVAPTGENTVAVYPDEDTFNQMMKLKKQGGMAGMLGDLGKNFVSRQVDNGTPVRIVGSTERGYLIEITDGPEKGVTGFVSKESVE
jgi:hypothetical protein